MNKKISISAFKQYATTDYKREDFSIVNVDLSSEPQIQPLNASDYIAMWEKMFIPTNYSNSNDLTMMRAFTFSLTWMLRLYDDDFPDDTKTPLMQLQNFLAIPLQFMVTCVQFANSSTSDNGSGILTLPENMHVTAAIGKSDTRLRGKPWAVWTFIGSASLFIVAVGAVLLWMLLQEEPLPESSGYPEIDIVTRVKEGELSSLIGSNNLEDSSQLRKKIQQHKLKMRQQGGRPIVRVLRSVEEN
jgi:hypothetical protein